MHNHIKGRKRIHLQEWVESDCNLVKLILEGFLVYLFELIILIFRISNNSK